MNTSPRRRPGNDDHYLAWLSRQVEAVSNPHPSRTHSILLAELHMTPFFWKVANDDNRVADALDLRLRYADEYNLNHVNFGLLGTCSFLELLIVLANRLEFESEGFFDEWEAISWFWVLLRNIGLDDFTDSYYLEVGDFLHEVRDILDRVNARSYKPDGEGGLFPLRHPNQDQRKVELWYQMSAYLLEHGNY